MPYVIDGHNLIGAMPGLSLSDLDDEMALIEKLKDFARQQRREVVIFFDQAPPGRAGVRRFGRVRAFFVRQGKPADAAIEEFLDSLGGQASNWTVVSSDGRVQRAAHRSHARVVAAGEFSRILAVRPANPTGEGEPDDSEMHEWLRLFGEEEE